MKQQKHHYTGLTDKEVLESRQQNGTNILTPPEKEPLWKQFLEKFEDPLIIILLVAGVLSILISIYEYCVLHEGFTVFFEPIGIFVAILLATGLAFYFELNADKAFSLLNQVNDDELTKVIRNSNVIEVPKKDIVVGDVVILSTGDEVPADGKLLEAVTLQMDESSLTGEPVCNKTTNEKEFDSNATYPSNHVLRGTKVTEGHGIFKVEKVGDATENGKVFVEAQIDSSVKTPLNEQLDGLSNLITNLSYGFAAFIIVGRLVHFFNWTPIAWTLAIPTVIFFWLVIKKFEDWSKKVCIATIIVFFAIFIGMILFLHQYLMPGEDISGLLAHTLNTLMIAVTLIVVAVPEGLPMAVTLSLAYSMRSMLKTNNLVRKMHACETMGATTVICTDKTGTLTQNKMQVAESTFTTLTKELAEGIAVNTTASLDLTAKKEPKPIGNPTEGALLLWLNKKGFDYLALRESCDVIDEVPFSTERKYMSTTVKSAITGEEVTYTKGAPEIVFAMCDSSDIDETVLKQTLKTYQDKAFRTLGFACNKHFLGVVGISDPVRSDVPAAVKECIDAGIAIKIVTGDTPGTAKEIGRQIGLWSDTDKDSAIITGDEFATLSDKELQDRVLDLKIIARARPLDKKRLVEALQAKNQVVAVTGDGTNDAPALKAAHVGLSMGDGTSVAKEASDITIIDNSFSSIGRAVMWGRSLYQNIKRFLLFQLTVNVSACLIVLVGAFMGTESPLTVTQMLWVNLIMDTFGAMALASLPPSERVMKDKPRDRNAFILDGPMYRNIIGVGTVFFLMLLILLYIFQHAEINSMCDFLTLSLGKANPVTPYEQTLLFSIFVWTHFWYMFNARSFETDRSIFHNKLSGGFKVIVLIIIVGQLLITELLPDFFNVEPMLHNPHHPHAWIDLVTIIILSSLVLWIRELWHLVSPKK